MQKKKSILSQNIKFLRILKNLSQTALAEKVGLTRSRIASYEAGLAEPKIENFLKIADFFEVDPKYLVEDKLSDHLIDSNKQSNFSETEELNSLISTTTEVSKIYEGFKLFYTIKKSRDAQEHLLSHQLEDVMKLLKKLLDTNWAFIKDIMPEDKE